MRTAVHARMPFVGRTSLSPSNAFSNVDLPAPVVPQTTHDISGSARVWAASRASSEDRESASAADAQPGCSARIFFRRVATQRHDPTHDASAFIWSSTLAFCAASSRAAASAKATAARAVSGSSPTATGPSTQRSGPATAATVASTTSPSPSYATTTGRSRSSSRRVARSSAVVVNASDGAATRLGHAAFGSAVTHRMAGA
mmetsp:Transcript_33648/g.103260  ORF Transcript_33648/g.103260 Transcript_33648/m.103260 type:complete len:201 (+) Transcript_33648:1223-1825(+)